MKTVKKPRINIRVNTIKDYKISLLDFIAPDWVRHISKKSSRVALCKIYPSNSQINSGAYDLYNYVKRDFQISDLCPKCFKLLPELLQDKLKYYHIINKLKS